MRELYFYLPLSANFNNLVLFGLLLFFVVFVLTFLYKRNKKRLEEISSVFFLSYIFFFVGTSLLQTISVSGSGQVNNISGNYYLVDREILKSQEYSRYVYSNQEQDIGNSVTIIKKKYIEERYIGYNKIYNVKCPFFDSVVQCKNRLKSIDFQNISSLDKDVLVVKAEN